MNIIILIVICYYLLFLILSSYYLINRTKIRNSIKYIMTFLYFIIIVILNINIINMYSYNYSKKISSKDILKNQEINLKKEINKNKKELEILKNKNNKFEELSNELNDLINENNKYKENINENNMKLEELNKKLNKLEDEYDKFYKESEFVISPFPTYHQFPNYPNGCESVALHLLLKYNGVNVSVEDIVKKLKKGDRPYRKNGKLYGGDPEIEFVGDPRSTSGYGVYELPIIVVAEYYKNGIKNITGSNLNEVLKIVRTGKPVQVWVSINLNDTYICSRWISTSSNKTINWLCGLHSLIIIGYSYDEIITSDPYTGKIEKYDRIQFEKIYNTYGKRAIYYE